MIYVQIISVFDTKCQKNFFLAQIYSKTSINRKLLVLVLFEFRFGITFLRSVFHNKYQVFKV
jgi:hypothetical protein